MTPREIIAEAVCDCKKQALPPAAVAILIDDRLDSAGYHILSDADLAARDDAVLERAAKVAESRDPHWPDDGDAIAAALRQALASSGGGG